MTNTWLDVPSDGAVDNMGDGIPGPDLTDLSGQRIDMNGGCCETLVDDFKFTDIREAQPPPLPGVYVIRIAHRGQPVPVIVEGVRHLLDRIGWPMLTAKVLNRVERLHRISDCDAIYLGSAGTYKDSKNTLLGRYGEFAGRHTAMYPIWALLAGGWVLDRGWHATPNAALVEAELKDLYRRRHGGMPPALVSR